MNRPITLADLDRLQLEIAEAEGWEIPYEAYAYDEFVPDEDGEQAYERMLDNWASQQTMIDAEHGV